MFVDHKKSVICVLGILLSVNKLKQGKIEPGGGLSFSHVVESLTPLV